MILMHLIAMKTKPLILFGIATVAAFATTLSGQNASPSGTLPPKRNQKPGKQKPASVQISPKPTAIPSRASTKEVISRTNGEASTSVIPRHCADIATSVMIAFGGSSTTLSSSWLAAAITTGIQITGVRHGVMILPTKVTTTMDQSTHTVTCCPTKLSLMCSMP
jgi:hypothetical protein